VLHGIRSRSGGGPYLARSTATFWPTGGVALPPVHAPVYIGGEVWVVSNFRNL